MRMLILLAVAFGLTAAPAQAGPVGAAIAAIGAVIKGSVVLTALAQMGASLVLSAIARKLGPKPSQQGADVKFNVEMGDDLPLSFILGDYATAGRRKYIGSWGRNQRFITDVIEISALPQPALAALWIGDEKAVIDFSRIGTISGAEGDVSDVTELPVGASFSGQSLGHPAQISSLKGKRRIWVRWVDGTQTTVDPLLAFAFTGDQYPWAGVGVGKAYAVVTMQYDREDLTSMPTLLFQPAPLPVYDPRKDSSTGGSGSHRWGDRSTYEPSTNAAVIAYNIVRGIYYGSEWIFGGRNLPAWRLPRAEWVAAMTACDREIETAGGVFEPAWRCGLEVSVDQTAADVLEAIGRAANLRFAEVGGQLKPLVDLPAAAVFSITDGDIVITEGQSLTPFYPVAQTFNALSASYPEPREGWASKDAPQRIDAAATAADGGRYLPTSVSYPACPYATQVQRLMVSQLSEYRRMRQHSMTLPPDAWALEPLDVISWTSARNGYADKKFMVEQVTKLPGLSLTVALREVDPSDYDWSPALELPVVITPPVKPIGFAQGIEGWAALAVLLTGNDGKARKPAIQVSCGANEPDVSEIRIQVERSGVVQFDVTRPYGAPFVWTITDVVQETTYRVRGALISERTGSFVWSPWITVTTQGISVWMDDLAQDIRDEFERLASEGGIKVVDTLPTAGTAPDQLVMLSTTKKIWRWDAPTAAWSDQITVAIGDGQVLAQHIAANNILAAHIGAGQVTADKISVAELSAITAI
ncbi:phage tail protein, partial [Falsigemmobacter faecalis]